LDYAKPTGREFDSLAIGTLFLIVGPSGVGKDTLMDGAKAALAHDDKFVFPARFITRPADAGGEQHIEVSAPDFESAVGAGHYALSWHAHGLGYGIPLGIKAMLESGHHVVVNVSRSVLDQARDAFVSVRIISISAPSEVLAQRLAARGRETAAEIDERIGRAAAYNVSGPDVTVLVNDSDADTAIEKLVAILSGDFDEPV
jgi:ribose 1,5-bisphosphokinase